MDRISPERRSENMRRIRSKDTKAELIVRRLVHSMGYRYRLHMKGIPGKPDLFPKRRKVIFNRCFWHQHDDRECSDSRVPKSHQEYWLPKLNANKERDAANQERLINDGWQVLVIWECEISNLEAVKKRIVEFLGPQKLQSIERLGELLNG